MRLEVVPEDKSGAGKRAKHVRLKTYLKSPEQLTIYSPLPDVASRRLGCTWTEANNVALVDTAGCNLNCWGCYQRGRSPEAEDVSPGDVIQEFVEGAADVPVWRISGGEPTLQGDLPAVCKGLLEASPDHIVWLNTNGLGPLGLLPLDHPRFFVEVSLKGLTDEWAVWNAQEAIPGFDVLPLQLKGIELLAHCGAQLMLNVWTTAPPNTPGDSLRAAAFDLQLRLRPINERLPLLVTPVVLGHYDWMPEWREHSNDPDAWDAGLSVSYPFTDWAAPKASFLFAPPSRLPPVLFDFHSLEEVPEV